MNKYLEHLVQKIPSAPGVYKMKDQTGEIIYIGKAKDLKKRVSSYFQNKKHEWTKTQRMIEKIEDIEYILTSSELEALMLETNLIKEIRPKYNILMKDDKNYAYIKITVNEDYPKILIVRKVLKDKAKYIGPKTNAGKIIKTLKIIRKVFPFRHCLLEIEDLGSSDEPLQKRKIKVTKVNIKYPCIYFHIKRCLAPCIGKCTKEEFREVINQVIRFLEGKHEEITEKLKSEMMQAAVDKKFELAARIRDKLKDIEEITEEQLVIDPDLKNSDIINYHLETNKIYLNLFQVRNGKLIDQENFILKTAEEEQNQKNEEAKRKNNLSETKREKKQSKSKIEDLEETEKCLIKEEIISSFLQQYYSNTTDIPSEILIPYEIEKKEILETWLSEMKGQKIKIIVPQKGKRKELLELAYKNAKSYSEQSTAKWEGHLKTSRIEALEKLQKLFNLVKIPKRLECYDISHFGGTETVASMSVFENGFPLNKDYRHFKVHLEKSGEPNDFLSLEETLKRRLKYLKPSLAAKNISLKLKKNSKPEKEEDVGKENPKKYKKKEIFNSENSKLIYEIFEEKEVKGSIEAKITDSKKFIIEKIDCPVNFLEPTFKKLFEKIKEKRIYLLGAKQQNEIFFQIGFQEVKKIPDDMEINSQENLLVFDKNKYKIDESFKKIPDLIVIDGGKGQLSATVKALKAYNLDLPIISIAKREEEFFIPGQKKSLKLPKEDSVSLLLQHLRDEAHRFAINYQKNLRLKVTIASKLDQIYGIGENYKKILLKKFGSVEGIKNASEKDLEEAVGQKLATKLKKELQ